jgi:hypothetical protein
VTPSLELMDRIVKACGEELRITIGNDSNVKTDTANK